MVSNSIPFYGRTLVRVQISLVPVYHPQPCRRWSSLVSLVQTQCCAQHSVEQQDVWLRTMLMGFINNGAGYTRHFSLRAACIWANKLLSLFNKSEVVINKRISKRLPCFYKIKHKISVPLIIIIKLLIVPDQLILLSHALYIHGNYEL